MICLIAGARALDAAGAAGAAPETQRGERGAAGTVAYESTIEKMLLSCVGVTTKENTTSLQKSWQNCVTRAQRRM